MKKTLLLFAAISMSALPEIAAQEIVETQPAILQEASQNVKIIYYADRGNRGLMDYTGDVYAHTGVITSLSTSSSDWKYAPAKWGDNSAKYLMTRKSANVYELDLGTIRGYYGITNATETVSQLAFVFRNADGTRDGKTAAGGDIFVTVAKPGFQVQLTSDASSNLITSPTEVNFTLNSTSDASLAIKVNGTTVKSGNGTQLTASYKFSEQGSYTVEGSAMSSGNSAKQTISITYAGESPEAPYPGGGVPKMGAVKNADGTVTFCLAAPLKKSVMLVPSWDNYEMLSSNVMNRCDYEGVSYFWKTVPGLADGQYYMYYYIVDGTIKVADPYARLVLDPYSDKYLNPEVFPDCPAYPYDILDDAVLAVYKSDINDYDWKATSFKIPAHSNLIVYEMLLRDFTGTVGEAKGNGNLLLAMEKLEYLRDLGVNVVELMPIMEFNGNNSWGYNTNFYFAPDKYYGSPTDYKEFIDKCHEYGMAVVLDIVFNQCDGLNPWYMMYKPGDNPFFNKEAPHDYSVLNDWNQSYPLVEQQWKDCLTYWMTEYNVDGFRFDLVKGLGDNDSYGSGTEAYNASRVARMKRMSAIMKSVKPDAIHINENLAQAQEENEMAADGQLNWSNINSQSSHFAEGNAANSSLGGFYAPNYDRTWGSTVSYAESHDEQRVNYNQQKYGANDPIKRKVGPQMVRLGSMAAQMLMSPGSHMIWQFGELGDGQNTKNANGGNNTDPKIVVWNYLDDPDRKGLCETYAALNWIRRDNAELFAEDATVDIKVGDSDWAKGRTIRLTKGDKELVLLVNPEIRTTVTVSSATSIMTQENAKVLVATYGTTPTATVAGGNVSVSLAPGSFALIGTDNVQSAITDIASDSEQIKIYGGEGKVIVEGNAERVNIYTLTGTEVNNDNLMPGLYIVRAGSHTAKVIVR